MVTNDGQADSNIATVSITVSPVNDPPAAYAQTVNTEEYTAIGIVLMASDVDGDLVGYSVMTQPSYGILSGAARNLTNTPDQNYCSSDSFTILANDGQLDSNIATVSITILPANPTDTVTILKATSSAGRDVTLTATAYDALGNSLGIVTMAYHSRKSKFIATIPGLASKTYRLAVISISGGSVALDGHTIGGT